MRLRSGMVRQEGPEAGGADRGGGGRGGGAGGGDGVRGVFEVRRCHETFEVMLYRTRHWNE